MPLELEALAIIQYSLLIKEEAGVVQSEKLQLMAELSLLKVHLMAQELEAEATTGITAE